jgi:Cdc6-like AAA superfamily ATPase
MRLSEVKEDFFELFEEKAIEMIARKVARMNGDVRVAFDLIKTCFNKIFY